MKSSSSGSEDAGVFDEPLCNRYANGGYERLFDFTVPGKQMLSDVYGLGTCGLFFFLNAGARTRPSARESPRRFAPSCASRTGTPLDSRGRKSVYLRGRATREAVTKTFEWSFRIGIRLSDCASLGDLGYVGPASRSISAAATSCRSR